MELPVTLHQKIVDFWLTLPNMTDPKSREALLLSASVDAALYGQLDFSGPSVQFFQRLLPTLSAYGVLQDGRYALEAVLGAAQGLVGQDGRETCAALLAEISDVRKQQANTSQKSGMVGATPPDQAKTVVVVSGEGRRLACVIGTNAYDDPALPPLSYPEANVDAFTRILEDKRLGDFDQVVTLKGKTHTEIVKEIKRLSGQLKVADLLLIYVSGYALLDKDDTGKLYLIAQNTDPAELPSSAVDVERIKTLLDNSAALQKILILDCQYGGQSPAAPVPDPELVQTQLRLVGQGKYLISNPLETGISAKPTDAEESCSLLTQYLLEGLTTGKADLDQSGKITVAEWYTYTQRQMSDRGLPAPLKWDDGVVGDWIVARTASASEHEAKALPTSLKRNYKYLSERFRDGSIIPFLGSETVMATVPPDSDEVLAEAFHEPPLERDLAQKLAEQAELLENAWCNPLPVISQYYQAHAHNDRLFFYRQLKKLFPQHMHPGPIHRFLAQQEKPMLVITASYDTLLEHVFREQGKPYAVVAHVMYAKDKGNLGKMVVQYSDRPENAEIVLSDELSIDLDQWWVFYKIQGTFDMYITGLGGQEEVDSIVIAEEDYFAWLSRLNDQHRAIPTLFYQIFQERPFLFLGYRMCDWNFRALIRTLRNQQEIMDRGGYAVRQKVSDLEQSYWRRMNVEIIDSDTADFIIGLAEEMNIRV